MGILKLFNRLIKPGEPVSENRGDTTRLNNRLPLALDGTAPLDLRKFDDTIKPVINWPVVWDDQLEKWVLDTGAVSATVAPVTAGNFNSSFTMCNNGVWTLVMAANPNRLCVWVNVVLHSQSFHLSLDNVGNPYMYYAAGERFYSDRWTGPVYVNPTVNANVVAGEVYY